MSRFATPNALSEGMAKRAMPSRFALVLWLFSHLSADWTSSSSDRALTVGSLRAVVTLLDTGSELAAFILAVLTFTVACLSESAVLRYSRAPSSTRTAALQWDSCGRL